MHEKVYPKDNVPLKSSKKKKRHVEEEEVVEEAPVPQRKVKRKFSRQRQPQRRTSRIVSFKEQGFFPTNLELPACIHPEQHQSKAMEKRMWKGWSILSWYSMWLLRCRLQPRDRQSHGERQASGISWRNHQRALQQSWSKGCTRKCSYRLPSFRSANWGTSNRGISKRYFGSERHGIVVIKVVI